MCWLPSTRVWIELAPANALDQPRVGAILFLSRPKSCMRTQPLVALLAFIIPCVNVVTERRVPAAAVDCLPTVMGPIPITVESQPYRGLLIGPPQPGYVEEEFFFSCAALGQSYQTLLHVRR